MKRKTFRERFEDNYMAVSVPADNKKGFKIRYIYYKPWHIWNLPPEELKKKKILFGVLFPLSFILFLFSGGQYTGVNFDRLVGIPTMFSVIAFLFEALGIIQFCVSKYRTTEQNYNDITGKIMFSTLAHAILLSFAAGSCIVYMANMGFSAGNALVAVGYFASAALAVFIRTQYRGIPLKTEMNMNLDKFADSGEKKD